MSRSRIRHELGLGPDSDVGDVKLKSITAWRRGITKNSIDLDGSPLVIHTTANRFDQRQWSEELQAGTTIGNLDRAIPSYN